VHLEIFVHKSVSYLRYSSRAAEPQLFRIDLFKTTPNKPQINDTCFPLSES